MMIRPATIATADHHSGGERLFVAHYKTIQSVIGTIARRHQLSREDADDFAASVYLRLINDDYAILRKFQGRSTLRTFLIVVIHRMFLDYRTAEWGKWRTTERSRRRGKAAMMLERLIVRDGFTFEQACLTLETNHGMALDRGALEQLATRFPQTRQRPVTEDALEGVQAPHGAPDEGMAEEERTAVVSNATTALSAALATLPSQDRLILNMFFTDGLSCADVARTLKLDAKQLYRRMSRLMGTLRRWLEARGISGAAVLAALDF